MYEHNAMGYRLGLALYLTKVRSSLALCPATALIMTLFVTAIKNGFKLETPKQQWFFATETEEEKFNWISLLEQSIRGAMQG